MFYMEMPDSSAPLTLVTRITIWRLWSLTPAVRWIFHGEAQFM